MPEPVRVREHDLRAFVERALSSVGVDEQQARIASDVLVAADRRGIESHGVARLRWFYVDRIRNGRIAVRPRYEVVRERPTSLLLDAGNGLGHPASHFAMARTIEKARESGIAFAAVRNSNHYGIAGYYVLEALARDLIGWSMTNTTKLVAPLWGAERMLGTNPISLAFPGEHEPAIVIDMATCAAAYGKIEMA
ncbi:MAG TPA: Ldh family oxidoreductase, partial [Dongiaceae bacterium]|nr:Ldh family oxidoreductase [Dongiaceae bacterium]